MKYSTEVVITRPIDDVVSFFDNHENYPKWMQGLQSFQLKEGTFGQPGAKTEFRFKSGKRTITMMETVEERNLPEYYSTIYEAKNVWNRVENKFERVSDSQTKYTTVHEFRFGGFMKLMGLLMPGAFKKQSRKYMEDFKQIVENGQ